jgi:Rrf2 family protein
MAVLGFHDGAEVHSADIAESVNAEPSFVRKSLSKLVKAGLVIAKRGKHGACLLARPPEDITLRDIYLASEAPTALANHSYPVEEECVISANIKGCVSAIQCAAQRSIEQALSKTTLADVVADIRMRAGEPA